MRHAKLLSQERGSALQQTQQTVDLAVCLV